MPLARYLAHPEVEADPAKPSRDRPLSDRGRLRLHAILAADALTGTTRFLASTETAARETAEILAGPDGPEIETRPALDNVDRSATGELSDAEFEALTDRFYAEPESRPGNWESATAAQARVRAEIDTCLEGWTGGDVLIAGHGTLGTLLWCALAHQPVSRMFAQPPGGGHLFTFDLSDKRPRSGWMRMERLLGQV